MDWTQILTLVGSNIALMIVSFGTTISMFMWARSEAREDQKEIREILREIKDEMKDFHGRLIKIEEDRNR